jgi:quercetin dioxygenase-like cupin family protein
MRKSMWAAALGISVVAIVAYGASLYSNSAPIPAGYVLHADEGEPVFGNSLIKVSPRTGAPNVALALMRTNPNGRSGLHIHHRADQIVLVTKGSGFATIGDMRTPITVGDTIFIPRGVWHEVGASTEGMEAVEIFEPGDAADEFRASDRASDGGKRTLTLDELNAISARYGSQFKDVGQ